MADRSGIEWTDATWNPVTGCSVVSPGCTNCYAMRLAGTRLKHHPSRAGLTADSKAGPVWNGEVRFNEQWIDQPLRWQRPRRVFVCAHGDLFHDAVPTEWIDRVFTVMAMAPRHSFQVLTKRAGRMREYVTRLVDEPHRDTVRRIAAALPPPPWRLPPDFEFPLPNVWLGVSAENQDWADERVPELLATPAAVRFVSAEPLVGPLNLTHMDVEASAPEGFYVIDALTGRNSDMGRPCTAVPHLDWVIAGGESGPGARSMHPDWVRSLRDQCAGAGVPFFFKQWGEWAPSAANTGPGDGLVARGGKKLTGKLLDGRQHLAFPGAS